jgi:hypothetical protein
LQEGLESFPVAHLDGPELDLRLLVDHRERLVRQRVGLNNTLRLNNTLQWHLHDLWPELEYDRNGSLGGVFDHVEIAVSDLAASERFYRTVLGTLGIEPSHADSELVDWDEFSIVPTDREHPVTRGLHVAFWAPTRELVHAFCGKLDESSEHAPGQGSHGPRRL